MRLPPGSFGWLAARVRQGATIILTTHILEVAERMADRIGVMAAGALIANGTLDQLRRQASVGHAGAGHASLEDTFLSLVAQDGPRDAPREAVAA